MQNGSHIPILCAKYSRSVKMNVDVIFRAKYSISKGTFLLIQVYPRLFSNADLSYIDISINTSRWSNMEISFAMEYLGCDFVCVCIYIYNNQDLAEQPIPFGNIALLFVHCQRHGVMESWSQTVQKHSQWSNLPKPTNVPSCISPTYQYLAHILS